MIKTICKWSLFLFLALIIVYGAWVIIAMNRTATLSVDYIAKINEVASSVPESERGWPHYRSAAIALQSNPEPSTFFIENELETPQWTHEAGWDHFDTWIQEHDETLRHLQRATSKEVFGYISSGKVSEEDKELWPDQYASQGEGPYGETVLEILLPQLSPMRNLARLLLVDAKDAASKGDTDRCLKDISAMLQIGIHVRQPSLLISDLVSLSIFNLVFQTIGQILQYEPALFSLEELSSLQESIRNLEPHLIVSLDGERFMMYDLLQRIYTDNGEGDGYLVPVESNQMLDFAELVSAEPNLSNQSGLYPALFTPIADVFFASRKEMREEYDARMDLAESRQGVPLYTLQSSPEYQPAALPGHSVMFDRYFLVNLLMPALDRALLQGEYTRANRDATLAVLYAVQWYNESGEWPRDLASAGVTDAWTGEPLKIILVEGAPLIYSLGCDQRDDGGMHAQDADKLGSGSSGDWVVWPNLE